MTTVLVPFTRIEAITAAWALKSTAAEAYCDERLTVAAAHYNLASRLFFISGYTANGNVCRQLATAIDQEAVAIASGDDDAAEYASSQIIEMKEAA